MGETDPFTLEAGHILRDWNARQYLTYYYGQSSVPDDEAVMFRFIARGLRDRIPAAVVGCRTPQAA